MKIEYREKSIKVDICNTFKAKLFGFMFKKEINKILCFEKCNSIHTFFMLKPIDVIMTDKYFNVVYIHKNLMPWRIILPKRNVFYTFELKPDLISVKIGDKLNIKK